MPVTPQQQAEIDALRAERADTRRATVPALEDVLYQPFPVLDHGFVRVVDYMGDDAAIVQAARVSYGRGTKRSRDDQGLINYLMRNAHTSPFEMCEIKLHVKLPIFVARQWIRHRTASVNEYSARYSILDREFYVPPEEQLTIQSSANAQGRGGSGVGEQIGFGFENRSGRRSAAKVPKQEEPRQKEREDEARRAAAKLVQEALTADADRSFDLYDSLHADGLARETARIGLPLSAYTQWYWKTDLHNLFHFLALRIDEHAQWEIREYAGVILRLVDLWVPLAAKAFRSYRLGGLRLSEEGLEAVRRLVRNERVDPAALEMSPREWRALRAALRLGDE